jgi:hypothetical protein
VKAGTLVPAYSFRFNAHLELDMHVPYIRFLLGSAMLSGACGDPLATETYRGDPLFALQGRVQLAAATTAPTSDLEVGVLWFAVNREAQVTNLETTVGEGLGSVLPAPFAVSIVARPSEVMISTFVTLDENGAFVESRAAQGVLVVAAAGGLNTLPESIPLGSNIGSILEPLTYASRFAVKYEPDGAGRFSAHDFTGWVDRTNHGICQNQVIISVAGSPEVMSCIDARAADIEQDERDKATCIAMCPTEAADSCSIDCDSNHNVRAAVEQECFDAVRARVTDAECGVAPAYIEGYAPEFVEVDASSVVLELSSLTDTREELAFGGLTLVF